MAAQLPAPVAAAVDATNAGDGDEVTVVAQVSGNGFNGPSTFTFLVDGDLVRRMTIRG